MYMYIYIYICMYVYICMYIYTYIYSTYTLCIFNPVSSPAPHTHASAGSPHASGAKSLNFQTVLCGDSRCSVYLRYWYKSALFTCFTGTKVHRSLLAPYEMIAMIVRIIDNRCNKTIMKFSCTKLKASYTSSLRLHTPVA